MKMNFRAIGVVVGLAVTGAVVGQVAQAATEGAPEPTAKVRAFAAFAANRTAAPGADDLARLASTFGTFERSKRATDALQGVPSAVVQGRPVVTSQVRKLGSVKGAPVFAAPVDGGVCLSSTLDVVSGCFPAALLPADRSNGADALDGLQAVICGPGVPPSSNALYGLVPSGISSFDLHRADGTVDTVPVDGNFVYYESPKQISPVTSISWVAADGSVVTKGSPFPSDFDESCS